MKLLEIHDDDSSNLNQSDRWLSRYTLENVDKWPSSSVVDTLLKKYPYDGGTLYRGLNFATAEQWEKFKEETNNLTKLETGSISSWSEDKSTTTSFAITRPTYFLNAELMQAESKKSKDRDYMIGHIGVILKTKVSKGVGIDVNKSDFGKESEVILTAGTYKIEVDTTHIPFVRSITPANLKKEFLSIKTINDDEIDGNKFAHIMFHYKEFDEEMQTHLYKLVTSAFKDLKLHVEIERDLDLEISRSIPRISIAWNIPGAFFIFYDMMLSKDQKSIDTIVQKALKQIDKKFDELLKQHDLTGKRLKIDVSPSVIAATKLEKYTSSFMDKAYQLLGARYQQLNSRENIKDINSIKDPEKKRQAINKLAKDMEQLLRQFK